MSPRRIGWIWISLDCRHHYANDRIPGNPTQKSRKLTHPRRRGRIFSSRCYIPSCKRPNLAKPADIMFRRAMRSIRTSLDRNTTICKRLNSAKHSSKSRGPNRPRSLGFIFPSRCYIPIVKRPNFRNPAEIRTPRRLGRYGLL